MTGMLLRGVPVYVSGMAGHFVDAEQCRLVLHFRIGDFRVSTVGGYVPTGRGSYQRISATAYSETWVYRVVDVAGHPEGLVPDSDWGSPLANAVAADSKNTREAERIHHLVACAVAICVSCGRTDDASIVAAVEAHSDG